MQMYFFDIYEIGRIDIFGAGRIMPVVFAVIVVIPIIEDMGIVSELS